MNMRFLTIMVFLGLLSACSDSPPLYKPVTVEAQEQRDRMIGRWYGEIDAPEGVREWIVERFPDSRFVVRFRHPAESGDGSEETAEVGVWGVSGSVYFTMTRGWLHGERISPADPMNANLYDAYEIHRLDDEVMRYRSVETGTMYEVRRVADDFDFPEL